MVCSAYSGTVSHKHYYTPSGWSKKPATHDYTSWRASRHTYVGIQSIDSGTSIGRMSVNLNGHFGIKLILCSADVINLVNYTGSLGFGQQYVDKLIGQAGSLDVQDCYQSAKYLIKIGIASEGPGKQFVQGGSHGGFLSAHRKCNFFL